MRAGRAVFLLTAALLAGLSAAAAQQESSRTIRGQVLGLDGKAAPEAIVHLKNRADGTVLTVVTDKDGRYLFAGIPFRVDYEMYAEAGELRSATRRVSSFDRRATLTLNFDLKKPEKKPEPAETERPPR